MGLLRNSEGRDKGGRKLVRPEAMNDKQQALQVGDWEAAGSFLF